MIISDYVKEYTSGNRIKFTSVLAEVHELLEAILKLDKKGIAEEFEDVLHFMQIWLYWRFGLNGEIWKITSHSVDKFIGRKVVWNKIYIYVGLSENISNFAGNYNKVAKVIKQLGKFGIDKEKAEDAHKKIVLEK